LLTTARTKDNSFLANEAYKNARAFEMKSRGLTVDHRNILAKIIARLDDALSKLESSAVLDSELRHGASAH